MGVMAAFVTGIILFSTRGGKKVHMLLLRYPTRRTWMFGAVM